MAHQTSIRKYLSRTTKNCFNLCNCRQKALRVVLLTIFIIIFICLKPLHTRYVLPNDRGNKLISEKLKLVAHRPLHRKDVMSNDRGNKWISERLKLGVPFVAGRLGATEGCLLNQYRKGVNPLKPCKDPHSSSGIYPETPELFEIFSKIYFNALGMLNESDAMATFSFEGNWEGPILEQMPSVKMKNRALEPFYFENPWSRYLENKTVLIVHGFISSIKCQMKRRKLLFSNPQMLPHFTAKFVKMPQCLGRKTPHSSYVETLGKFRELSILYNVCRQVIPFDFRTQSVIFGMVTL